MKKIKLYIILNGHWDSMPQKCTQLIEWFSKAIELSIVIKETSFTTIPYALYNTDQWGIEMNWYDRNIIPLAIGYDIVLFVVEKKDWHEVGNNARGWRTNSDQGIVELQISADEHEAFMFTYPDGRAYTSTTFFEYSRHEICHALYLLSGQQDNTHTYWDTWQLEKVLDEIDFSSRISKIRFIQLSINAITYLLNKLLKEKPQQTQLELWADGIKESEGWYKGSRSYRNNNPGNLKYAEQAGSKKADDDGFAIFKTYEYGWRALLRQLTIAAKGQSVYYHPDMTLKEFTMKYTELSDRVELTNYLLNIIKRLKVDAGVKIKDII